MYWKHINLHVCLPENSEEDEEWGEQQDFPEEDDTSEEDSETVEDENSGINTSIKISQIS